MHSPALITVSSPLLGILLLQLSIRQFIDGAVYAPMFSIYTKYGGYQKCRDNYFDQLANLDTPEAYHDAMDVLKAYSYRIFDDTEVWTTLVYKTEHKNLSWEGSGLPPAADIPWFNGEPTPPTDGQREQYSATIRILDGIWFLRDEESKNKVLCEMEHTPPYAVRGTSHPGQSLMYVGPFLRTAVTRSYLDCVSLCWRDIYGCRSLEYDTDLGSCYTFGALNYQQAKDKVLVAAPLSKTFIRWSYVGKK